MSARYAQSEKTTNNFESEKHLEINFIYLDNQRWD